MSAKQQSPRQSQEALQSTTPTQTLIVSGVSLEQTETNLCRDLPKTYVGVERVTRLFNSNNKPIKSIQIDFKSSKTAMEILKQKFILIDGKRYDVRGYWSLSCHRCHKEGHKAVDCPDRPSNGQQRMIQLFRQQEAAITTLINGFEAKWNERLSKLAAPSANVDVEKLLPIFNDLTAIFRQFNEQNAKMQRALDPVVSQLQQIHGELNEKREFPALPLPALSQMSLQNGH